MTDSRIRAGGQIFSEHDYVSVDGTTVLGSGVTTDPLRVFQGSPPFPDSSPVVDTIFVRLTGSNKDGDGKTEQTAFRTFQYALTQAPHLIPPGHILRIDITGIGVEELPPNFEFPSIVGPDIFDFNPPLPFTQGSSFTIIAMPQPATVGIVGPITLSETFVPVGDYTVSTDAATGRKIITSPTARASWAADNLKGKFLASPDSNRPTCAIERSDANNLYLCSSRTWTIATVNLEIVECSATLLGTYDNDSTLAAITINNCPMFAMLGVKLHALDTIGAGEWATALQYSMSTYPFFQMCDIQGITTQMVKPNFTTNSCVLRDRVILVDGTDWTANRSLLIDIPFFFCAGSTGNLTKDSVLEGCGALENSASGTNNATYPSLTWGIGSCTFRNGIDPRGAVYGINGGFWAMDRCVVDNPAGDGLYFEGTVQASLVKVSGTSLGLGVRVNDGANVRVLDDDTLITGAVGDMKVGSLAIRTWADFRANAPINNEYDIASPAVGDTVGTGDTFTFADPAVTITDALAPFTAAMIGSQILVQGATSSGNVTAGAGDSLAAAFGVVTLTDDEGLFTAGMTGGFIAISDSAVEDNNGVFGGVTFLNATTITYLNPLGADDLTFSGDWEVTDPNNNGTFIITAVGGGGTTATYVNPAGVSEPFGGGTKYTVSTGTTGSRLFQRPA